MIEPKTDEERVAVARGNRELSGVRLCFQGDCKVTIRRAGGDNTGFLIRYLHHLKPYQLAIEAGECSDDTVIRAQAIAYAETVILLIENEDGSAAPEGVRAIADWLLSDDDRFADIIAYSSDWRIFSMDDEIRATAIVEEQAA